ANNQSDQTTRPSCSYSQQAYTQPTQGANNQSDQITRPSCSYSQQAYTQPTQGANNQSDQTTRPSCSYSQQAYTQPTQGANNQSDQITRPSCSYSQQAYTQPTRQIVHSQPPQGENEENNNLSNLLSIICKNQHKRYGPLEREIYQISPIFNDPRCIIPSYKEWRLRLDNEFSSLVNELLRGFAEKLLELPCGSFREKELFLHKFSESLANHPLEELKEVIINFVNKHIEGSIRDQVKIAMTNSMGTENINKTCIIKTAIANENVTSKNYTRSLKKYISNRFKYFLEKKYAILAEGEFRNRPISDPVSDLESATVTSFLDAYREFIEGVSTFVIERSFDIFKEVVNDKKCKESFLFTTVLGNMVFYDEARILVDNLNSSTEISIRSLKDLLSSTKNTQELNANNTLTKLLLYSESLLRSKIDTFLLQNRITVLDDEENIGYCTKEFSEKISSSSLKYLKIVLNSHIQSINQ
uniref:hypothetical protein n=1 Tax=Candidatus Ichthyocystis sparus TaxID=1561004 RepID=UPI00159EF38A